MNKEIYIELYKVLSEKYQLKNEDSKEKFDSILSAYDSDVENIIIGEAQKYGHKNWQNRKSKE